MAPVDVQRIHVRGVALFPLARYRHRLSLMPPSRAHWQAYAATGAAHQSPEARDACEEAAFTAREAMDGARRCHRACSHQWHGYPVYAKYQDDEQSCLGHVRCSTRGGAAMRDDDFYPPYVPVRERRAKAEKTLLQLRKKQPGITPVIIAGNALATTWWGKSWNSNLERYADYRNRIGRGRSYVRHRAVLDLQLAPGHITALVQGSGAQPYRVAITVDTLSADHWATIRAACVGCFDSLSALLAGTFPQALKELFFAKGAGLFPSPQDIHFDCSCPDWAAMCKHVAAALYGVGARVDEDPSLFFRLRGIAMDDIITQAVADTTQTLLRKAERQRANVLDEVLDEVDLGDVFGIQLDDLHTPRPDLPSVRPKPVTRTKPRAHTQQSRAGTTSTPASQKSPAPRRRTPQHHAVAAMPATPPAALPPNSPGTMLEVLVRALGNTRKGKPFEELQDKLGWTDRQLRNAISRAGAKGFVEMVTPGVYRRKV
jgi:uncharacterized Zn finger protein